MSQDEAVECPLCMETLELDDLSFFPCTCGYQICRFCWHRLRTDENGLCPACRKQYTEDPANFKPLSVDEIQQKAKSERKAKKQRLIENRKHLANVRVVQKNLVFVVGLPSRLACAEQLKNQDCFGRFGKIHKVVVNQSTSYAGVQGPSASAYVTYLRSEDALRAIQGVNNLRIEGKTLKASLGTTKYCNHFLKGSQCPKADCMYLHELGDEDASFTKEQMQDGKHTEYERRLHDQLEFIRNNHKDGSRERVSPAPDRLTAESAKLPRSRHKSECSSEEPSSSDDQKSTTPLSERSDSPDIGVNAREQEEGEIALPNYKTRDEEDDDEDDEDEEEEDDDDGVQNEGDDEEAEDETQVGFSRSQQTQPPVSSPLDFPPQSSSSLAQPSSGSLVSDIELDFDPFYISRKGLADLIEREQSTPNHQELLTQPISPMQQHSPFGGLFSYGGMPARPSPPGMNLRGNPDGGLNLYQNLPGSSQAMGGVPPHSSLGRAPPPGFGPSIGSQMGHPFGSPFGQQSMNGPPMPHSPFFNQLGGNDMSRGGAYGYRGMMQSNTNILRSSGHDEMLSMKEQQDQLRQLLPSVNISFGPPTHPLQNTGPNGGMNHPPPGLHGLMNLPRQPSSSMVLDLGHRNNGNTSNGWPEALHDPAILSTSRQNATTTGPEQRGPPYF